MNHPLDGVRERIVRAEVHLATITAEIESHKNKCIILATKRSNRNFLFDLYANFPDPSLGLSCVVSDCLHNLRTALNYLVHELAFTDGQPPIHSLFPICNTRIAYDRQVEERDRLHNVPEEARAIIESLQPYRAKSGRRLSHPLYVLNQLMNAEKHRMLALTMACGSHPTFVINDPNGRTDMEAASITKVFYDGARIGGQTLTGIHNDKVAIQIRRGLYVAVKDLPEVDAVNIALGNVIGFIKDTVVRDSSPFLIDI
jgi:hypothetical protein